MKNVFSLLGLILSVISVNAQTDKNKVNKMNQENVNSVNSTFPKVGVATFGAGCFWCVEAMFQKLNGVEKVESGYMGGTVKNPTYKQVCTGETGHAEVIHITYNPNIVSYEELLEVFWKVHDPTTLNRQGADVGTQYRSVVFFHDENQHTIAEKLKKDLDSSGAFDAPIVTSIEPAGVFYIAEDYHQDYYNLLGGTNSYCQMVVKPKIEKFKKVFSDKIKH